MRLALVMHVTTEDADSLHDLVRRYRVCFDLAHELGPTGTGVRPIGFSIELAGSHPHEPGAPIASCAECARLTTALRTIAGEVLPGAPKDVAFSVDGPRPALQFTPKHGGRPDLTVTIAVLHRESVQRPVDDSEARARDEVVARLRALGVPEGAWPEGS
jgi:hypothetical protein